MTLAELSRRSTRRNEPIELDLATATLDELSPIVDALELRAATKSIRFDRSRGTLDLWAQLLDCFDRGCRQVDVAGELLTVNLTNSAT